MENTKATPKISLGRRTMRWCVVALTVLITLIAVLWTVENWRGKRAWNNYKQEWEAKGEQFDLKSFIPPTVPDDQNFAMTPFLAPLFDFNPNRKPGESVWRDTNAYQKVEDFGSDLNYPKNANSPNWNQAKRMHLTAWAEGFDGKKDAPPSGESAAIRAVSAKAVLLGMEKYGPVLAELRAASRRPHCRFNIIYAEENLAGILLPHLARLKTFSTMYRLRASAELAAGRNDAALEDVKMGLYLSKCPKSEPILISGLVQLALLNITLQPIWEGLADRRWSDAQLKELQIELAGMDLLKDYGFTIRGERAFGNGIVDYYRRTRHMKHLSENGEARYDALNLMPSGWYYQNQVTINQMYQEFMLPTMDAGKHRVYLDLSTNIDERSTKESSSRFVMYNVFARLLFPGLPNSVKRYAVAAAYVDEAVTACALERYRQAHGQFPETLDALSPQLIEKVPMDVVTGEPLKYRRTADGQFILYSVGWNGTDDGGTVVLGKGNTPKVDTTQGDWVWRYPAAE